MKVLVTGANGFVGSAVMRHLSKNANYLLAGAVRGADGFELAADTDWSRALAGVDCVVHTAARVHIMREQAIDPLAEFRRVNVHGTLALARQAVGHGVKRFIFLSSIKVNGEATLPGLPFIEADLPDPQDAYGVSKHEAERGLRKIAQESGMDVVIIRPPLVYGPGVKANFAALMKAVQKGWPLPLGAVHNSRSLLALDNLVDIVAVCISHPKAAGETFLVSDGRDISMLELVERLARAAEVRPRLVYIPVPLIEASAKLLGKRDVVRRVCGNLQVDISKVRSLLGWVPPVSVDEGLRRAISGVQKP